VAAVTSCGREMVGCTGTGVGVGAASSARQAIESSAEPAKHKVTRASDIFLLRGQRIIGARSIRIVTAVKGRIRG